MSSDVPIGYYHNPILQKRREVESGLEDEAKKVVESLLESDLMPEGGGLFFGGRWFPESGKFFAASSGDALVKKALDSALGQHSPEAGEDAEAIFDRLVSEDSVIGILGEDPTMNGLLVVADDEFLNLSSSQKRQIIRFFKPNRATTWWWTPRLSAEPKRIDPERSLGLRFDQPRRPQHYRQRQWHEPEA